MNVVAIIVAALSKELPKIDQSQIEYMGAICGDLAQNSCFEAEEWVAAIGPILGDWIDESEILEVCGRVIASIQQQLMTSAETKTPKGAPKKGAVSNGKVDRGPAKAEAKHAITVHVRSSNPVLVDMKGFHLGFMNGRMLLVKSDLHLERGHRYGLVGQNGTGKTTLMRRIALKDMPEFPKALAVVYVEHEIAGDAVQLSVVEFMKAGDKTNASDSAVRDVLSRMGFEAKMQDGSVHELSGGWRMRLALASATLRKADILLLDEPTNHLDVAAVAWLEGYLASLTDVCVMVVSHSPVFLDKVATDIILLSKERLHAFQGNFTQFTQQQKSFSAQDLVTSSTTTQEAFTFPTPEKLIGVASTRNVLKVSNVNFAYSEKHPAVLKDVSCNLMLVSRCAIVGDNGAGKSTLIKLIVGELLPKDGKIWRHHNLRVAYVAQHSLFHLEEHTQETAVQYIQQRFARGYDRESTVVKKGSEMSEERKEQPAGMQVESLVGRRKYKKELEYEVKWVGLDDVHNVWIPLSQLRRRGEAVMQMVAEMDENLRNAKSGIDQRSLVAKEVLKHLKDFGMKEATAQSKVEQLSGGQRSRLVLAAAMWNKPHLLILDEPTNFLDESALSMLAKALKHFRGGVVMVSHSAAFVSALCTEVWRIRNGCLVVEQKSYDSAGAAYNAPLPER